MLNENKVEYLVVGGYAVIIYGYPRLTIDIDIWINPVNVNAEKVIKTIKDFGFSFDNLTEEDFRKSDNVIQLGRPPYRVDILTSIEGMDFNKCYKRKYIYIKDDLIINFISRKDLIENKKNVGRNKDLDDVSNLT
ncbi:MAG TPA: hypothetical protein PK536_07190 [Ignavibacteria bacterium]|nr:hypothetical protein [Ignavibacteria bacterium]HRK00837.1 hypothetical protein [Ignavibacteria bacterium]